MSKSCTKNIDDKNNLCVQIGSYGIFLFLTYIFYIWQCEVFDLLNFFIGHGEVPIIVSRTIIFVVDAVIMSKFIIKSVKIQNEYKSNLIINIVVCVFILVFGIIKCCIPDYNYDTLSYHILAQKPGFQDEFTYNFAPGNFQLFGFRLADRSFYIIRELLGYRAGTLWNSAILVLCYFQVVQLINIVCGEDINQIKEKIKDKKWLKALFFLFKPEIFSFVIISAYEIVMETGTYMVEIVTIPFILEMLRVVFCYHNKNDAIYFSFVAGLLFATKMTNIMYIIPMVIVVVCKLIRQKEVNIKNFISCVVVGVIPVSVYLIYNIQQTGNPVFPYYNTLFKSLYFSNTNFKDYRWGPQSLKEILLWPYYFVFKGDYRQTEIPNEYSFLHLCMFVAILICIVALVYEKRIKNIDILNFIVCISFIIWVITTGHTRYYCAGFVLTGILEAGIVIKLLAISKKYVLKLLAFCMFGLMVIQPIYSYPSCLKGREWSWRNSELKAENVNLKENASYLFRDRKLGTKIQREKINAFILSSVGLGSVAYLVNDQIPIICSPYVNSIQNQNIKNQSENYIRSLFANNGAVYDIWRTNGIGLMDYVENLNKIGFYIESMESLDGFFIGQYQPVLVKVNLGEKNNIVNLQNDKYNFVYQPKIRVKATLGTGYGMGLGEGDLSYCVQLEDESHCYDIYKGELNEGQWETINQEIDISKYQVSDNCWIKIKLLYDQNVLESPYDLYIVNMNVE